MRFNKTKQEASTFQLAPMIDILFILLIFFIVTTSFQQVEKELSIGLPDANNSSEIEQAGRDIVINVTSAGTYIINRKTYTLDELEDLLKRTKKILGTTNVLLRADKAVVYQHVIRVMDLCAELEITRLSFVTKPEEEKQG